MTEHEEVRPGEKGPPAWTQRRQPDGEVMGDEPADSSGEVDQIEGLFYDEGDPDDG